MAKVNFRKGEFITHINNPKSFAIYGGEELPSQPEDNGKTYYSLICYYNPNQSFKDKFGNWTIRTIFDADIDDAGCVYSISDVDAAWWRRMNETEKSNAIKFLAEKKGLAYEQQQFKLRRLAKGETLMFSEAPHVPIVGARTHQSTTSSNTRYGGVDRSRIRDFRSTRTVNRNVNVPVVNSCVTKVTPEDYKQKKKIKGFTNRMNRLIKTVAKAENKKAIVYSPSYHSPYGFFYGDDYGYASDLPFVYDD